MSTQELSIFIDKAVPFNKVKEIVLGEIQYQESLWNENTTESKGFHTLPEFLVFISDYLDEAIHLISRNPEPKASLLASHNLRKILTMILNGIHQNKFKDAFLFDLDRIQQNTKISLSVNETLAHIKHYTNKSFEFVVLDDKIAIVNSFVQIAIYCMLSLENNDCPKR